MTAAVPALLTFAEFEQLPDPPDGHRVELHHGEVISVPPPRLPHWLIQQRMLRQLLPAAGADGTVGTELGFRVLPQEFRIADIGFISAERLRSDAGSFLEGAPELVIEVLSPSNTASEMLDKEQLCLENGCLEFWVVDPKRRQVRVSTRDGSAKTYKSGQSIPLMFGGELAVDPIFE